MIISCKCQVARESPGGKRRQESRWLNYRRQPLNRLRQRRLSRRQSAMSSSSARQPPGDDDFALWLAPRLEAAGYEVFADILNLQPGDQWRRALTSTSVTTARRCSGVSGFFSIVSKKLFMSARSESTKRSMAARRASSGCSWKARTVAMSCCCSSDRAPSGMVPGKALMMVVARARKGERRQAAG